MESIKKCPLCGSVLVKKSKNGKNFLACPGWKPNNAGCKGYIESIKYEKKTIEFKEVKKFIPTPEQRIAYDLFANYPGHIMGVANPGSGKSATITSGFDYIKSFNPSGVIGYTTFNRSRADELQAYHLGCYADSISSLCLQDTKIIYPKTRINTNKISDILDKCGLIEEEKRKKTNPVIVKVYNFLRYYMLDLTSDNIKHICTLCKVDYDESFITVLNWLKIEDVKLYPVMVDFENCKLIAIENKESIKKFDSLVGDECQDFTALELNFLLASLNTNGRLILVGDEKQSINGFRGADYKSVENIRKILNPAEFELTITFRQPKNHAEALNNKYGLNIQSSKEDGLMEVIKDTEFIQSIMTKDESLTVCRNNAPMVEFVFQLLLNGVGAVIRGKEIKEDLINDAMQIKNKYNVNDNDITGFIKACELHIESLYKKYAEAKNKSFIAVIEDRIEVLKVLCNRSDTITQICENVYKLFASESAKHVFSTIHKAKGEECKVVYLLHPELLPSPKAETEDEKQQEINLDIVARSRSLSEFIEVLKTK